MLNSFLLAAEGGAPATESHNPIVPELNELVYSLIAFLILLLLFKKFAFQPVKKGMEARTERIRKDLDQAEKAKTEAESILEDYKKQLADAKSESNRIIDEARQQAEKVKTDITESANKEVAEQKAKATEDIESARNAAIASLQTSVADMAIELAEKVVEKNLDREANQRLIDGFIDKVGS
ncbi:MAG: hypothetical protein AVDCRST_MAG76-2685 [uncultured Acidimicrobiales bacterium]|uniref:ATP synthase subunit b n=1 Tax=uncultured Acidimicrobiales bacterium TaxID=310071 RepID=A0A6J4IST4_9ACTN|nr:MAG: hypothetical protein AVDCRST_MAG76-2685 [uncultured Acidimicrobiales bacterium]